MAYCGIEFYNDTDDKENNGGIAIVHMKWLTPRKKEVIWPPYKTTSRFNKALISGEEPNENSWQLYCVKRIFFQCGMCWIKNAIMLHYIKNVSHSCVIPTYLHWKIDQSCVYNIKNFKLLYSLNYMYDWFIFLRICIVYFLTTDDLEKAHAKLKKCEDTSDVQSTSEAEHGRHRKRNRKYFSTSDEDEFEDSSILLHSPKTIKQGNKIIDTISMVFFVCMCYW